MYRPIPLSLSYPGARGISFKNEYFPSFEDISIVGNSDPEVNLGVFPSAPATFVWFHCLGIAPGPVFVLLGEFPLG